MKKKWIYLLVAGLSVATIATVDAQRVPFRGPRGAEMMDELGLSDEQKTQVQTLRDAHRKEMQALRASGERPNPEKMEQLFAAHREQIEKILTPEQREKMAAWHGPMMGRHGGWGKGGPMMDRRDGRGKGGPMMGGRRAWNRGKGGPMMGAREGWGHGKGGPMMGGRRGPGRRPFAQLDLSDEQREQVRSLQEKQRDAVRELMKKQREAMQALTKKHREAMEKVLTKEQRTALEEAKDETFYRRGARRGGW